MLNCVQIQGRFTTTPELKFTGDRTPVVSFTLAVDRNYINKETGFRETDFIRCNAWRSQAEFICQNFQKGDYITISGHMQTKFWNDSQGVSRQDIEVLIENAYYCGLTKKKTEAT